MNHNHIISCSSFSDILIQYIEPLPYESDSYQINWRFNGIFTNRILVSNNKKIIIFHESKLYGISMLFFGMIKYRNPCFMNRNRIV